MTSPYSNKKLFRVVPLYPNQMNTDLYKHLKKNLLESVTGRCIEHGYIIKIYELISYKNGILEPENFSAIPMYDVTYSARLCCPIIGSTILCKIVSSGKTLLEAKNGPIRALINPIRHDPNNFTINSAGDLIFKGVKFRTDDEKKKQIVQIIRGDIIKIKITGKQFDQGAEYIFVTGTIENMATEKEEIEFYSEINEKKDDKFIKPSMVNIGIDGKKNSHAPDSGSGSDSDNDSDTFDL